MTLIQYTAEVKSGLLLELPAEAETLHLKPGDKIQVQLNTAPQEPVLDEKAKATIAMLDSWIAEGEDADEATRLEAERELEEFLSD